jgi:hypothetical protein
MRQALVVSMARLEALRVPFAVCGGLAVGAHGHIRATDDIDLLVGDEAFETDGPIVTLKPGVPLEAHGVAIDLIPESAGVRVIDSFEDDGVPVVSLTTLLQMKLGSWRPRDRSDVRGLIEAGAVDEATASDLDELSPDLAEKLWRLLGEYE